MSTKQSLASAGLDINYFSYYPNNFLITAIGRWFWNFLNLIGYHKYSDFVIGMGLLNYILVDLSILLLYRSLNSIFNKKKIKNTQNGTFGWGEEGNYLYQLFKQKGLNQLQKKQRKIFMFYKGQQVQGASVNWTGHKLTIQMIWLVVLIGILFSLRMNSFRIQLFKLSVLGGMLFLLIFEGGRSRYLIQFLPFLFVLSGAGMNNLFAALFDKYSE